MPCAVTIPRQKKLRFAGANNPLWLIRRHEGKAEFLAADVFDDKQLLVEYKANKQPIGVYAERVPFSTQEVHFEQGDIVYLFSDGMADQFGGDKGRKMKSKPLKEFLLSLAGHKMSRQQELIFQHFENWSQFRAGG